MGRIVPSVAEFMAAAVEVPAYNGEWRCPECKKISWYNSVPHPRILALQATDADRLRVRQEELRTMIECFQDEILAHMEAHYG